MSETGKVDKTFLHPFALKSNVRVLKIIANAGSEGIYQSGLALELGVSQPYVTQILDRLEYSGLVRYSYQKGTRSIRKVYTLIEPEWYGHVFLMPLDTLLNLLYKQPDRFI